MLITPLESEVYDVSIPSDRDIEKAILLKNNACIDDYFSLLKGFWLLYHEEIKHLNPNKIHSMEKFFSKVDGYCAYKKRFKRRLARR